MRLFVALDIEVAIRQRILEFRNQMRPLAPEVRWVSPESYHVTLQFLGETDRNEEVQRALRQVKSCSIDLSFRGAGFFPTPKSPRVFWIGIEADERLQALVNSIAHVLRPLGFKRDAGPFRPHLTLARRGSGRPSGATKESAAPGLKRVELQVESMGSFEFGTMTAREFCLYQSKLSPGGSVYTNLAKYLLQ